MNYEEHISSNLKPYTDELYEKKFLIDESAIQTYEEIISLFKLPQLKELAKQFHIGNGSKIVTLRSEFIKLILQHFKTQKSLKFHVSCKKLKNEENNVYTEQNVNKNFMFHCKKILGKCFKLDKASRDVFIRILMLYNLSSTFYSDARKGNDSGQHQL